MKDLEQELLEGLKNLSENDCDLRSLTIWCNPNFIRSSDRETKIKILEILKRLKKENKITSKRKTVNNMKYVLYSLI